jgi:P4 family phage/plasmid primase-like protien
MSLVEKLENKMSESESEGLVVADQSNLNIDIKSLNTDKKKKTINQKLLEGENRRKDVNNYDDIWSKGVPSSFWALKELSDRTFNITDIATVIYKSDFGDMKTWRAIVNTPTNTSVYIPICGIWVEQKDHSRMRDLMERYMIVMKKMVIDQIIMLQQKAAEQIGNVADTGLDVNKLVEHYKFLKGRVEFYTKLYNFIGNRNQDAIIKRIIDKMVKETIDDEDFKVENFNKAAGYIAFNDGVYSFKEKGLISEKEAKPLLFTKTTGYAYDNVLIVKEEDYNACHTFIRQIIPNDDIRRYVLSMLNKAFRSETPKKMMFWHGAEGNNGKTKLLELIKTSLGKLLFCTANKSLLNEDTFNASGAANEALMKLMDTVVASISEPNKTKLLDMAALKLLTGGDEISGRKIYREETDFKAKALIIVACNDIPSINDTGKASFGRINCVPFYSIFVENKEDVDEENHKYLQDETISTKFQIWKYAFMKIVLESNEDVETPEEVMEHTKSYREQEDTIAMFVKEKLIFVKGADGKADRDIFVKRSQLWYSYKDWYIVAKDEKKFGGSKAKTDFEKRIKSVLGAYIKDTGKNEDEKKRKTDGFFGYKIKKDVNCCEYDSDGIY